jgi:amino acid adenylation domain-containing protein
MTDAAPISQATRLSAERQKLLELRIKGVLAGSAVGIRLSGRPRSGPVRLSFAQERLWLLEQLEAVGAAYHLPCIARINKPLDVAALERSVAEVERRHEAVRTRFAVVDGEPVQVIDPPGQLRLVVENLSELGPAERQKVAQARIREHLQTPFDLAKGPLLRASLLHLAARNHVLLLTMHHIVSDGWSLGVLLREIGTLYAAFVQGRPSPLSGLPIQYADYALWQRDCFAGDGLARQVAYWKQQLAGVPARSELPADRPRPPVQSFAGATVGFVLPVALTTALTELGRREGATPFMVLLAALQVVLSRWSGQMDIVVGTPIAGRTHRETEGLIGLFMNMLALRTDLSGDPSFRELLRRVKETALGAYAHQDLPFEKLVEVLQPVRDLSRAPIFQVMLALQSMPLESKGLPGLRLERPAVTMSKLDLSLYFRRTLGGLQGWFEYATDLFDRGTIERLAGHLETLLRGAVAAPDCRLSDLPLLSEGERRQLLVEWNATAADYPSDRCVHDLFAEQAARTPDAVALVYEDSALTYDELDRRSNRLAHHLRGLGVGPEMVVGLCVERSLEMVVGLLGVLKAGGAYLPLDPDYPPVRLTYMVADAGAPVVVTQARLVDQLPAHEARVVKIDADWAEIARCPDTSPRNTTLPENLAYVIYTSGSTGKPKGVMIKREALVNLLSSMAAVPGIGASDVMAAVTPLSFDIAGLEIYLPLLVGARVALVPGVVASDGGSLRKCLAALGASVMQATPASWRLLHQAGWNGAGLKVLCGGEALPADFAAVLMGQTTEVWNLYGPTETTIWSTADQLMRNGAVSIGRPISNTRVYVLDGELSPVPIGVCGELYIGGAGLARGYFGRAGLTGERFVANPYGEGDRLYRSGDLARWRSDGELEYLGRIDHQVKVRGYRIELGEIEARLVEHGGVDQAVVVAREDAPGDKRLVAYVVGEGVGAGELRAHLKRSGPEYMVPSAYVVLEALPLTSNGKVDRSALPAPAGDAVVRGAHAGPRTPTEEVLASIWCEVLELDRVGVDDNFFELGGHSLPAMRVVARIRDTFHLDLPLRALFDAPRISALSERVDLARRAGARLIVPALVAQPRPAQLPLSFAQERLWVLERLEAIGAAYNISRVVRLSGRLDVAALERAFAVIVDRHEALRTRFEEVDDGPVQVIDATGGFAMGLEDFSALGPQERAAAARRRASEIMGAPFDLRHGPLFRAMLLKLSAEEHVVAIAVHHIVSDGWSIGVLIREVGALYGAFACGQPSPLPALSVQYADYALWQRSWLKGEVLAQQGAYWKQQLAGAPAALELPSDRPRPPVQSFQGAVHGFGSPAPLAAALREFARAEGVTLFMVLLAAFQVVLARWTGQTDIVVGTPIAGRRDRMSEGLIGFFVNMLPLRTDLSGDPSFRTLLHRVKQTALAAYAHQDLPFEKLVEELHPARDLSRQPVFQILLALQNVPQETLELPGLRLSRAGGEGVRAKLDLSVHVHETPSGLQGHVEYAVDLFDRRTIERLVGHFVTLLQSIVACPEHGLSKLPLLTEEEKHQLLIEWNDTAADCPQDRCLHELFADQAAKMPDAVALVFEDQHLSYAELERRSNQLAHHLHILGAGPDVVVGLRIERSLEMVVGVLAILKAGSAYLPLDPRLPQDRLVYLVTDAKVGVLVTCRTLADGLPHQAAHIVCLDTDWEGISQQPMTALDAGVDPRNLAYVLYTSGSTGRPKGVWIEHRNVVNYLWAIRSELGLDCISSYLMVQPLSVDSSVTVLYASLLFGGTLHVVSYEMSLDAGRLAGRALQQPVDCLKIAPPHLQALLETPECTAILPTKLLILGGDIAHWEFIARLRERAPGLRIVNHYGPTEVTVGATTYTTHDPGTREGTGRVPIGRPLANTQAYILDGRLDPVPIGVLGELYLGGPQIARGYVGQPVQTAQCFIPAPFAAEQGARLYRTGDRARFLRDGTIEFLGRIDSQIKIRGYRVEPDEIANVLMEHTGVSQAVVMPTADGNGERSLIAYVATSDGTTSTLDLRQYLADRLPRYMVPQHLVMLEAVPRTAHGKLDRKALPAPSIGDRLAVIRYQAPRDEIELRVQRIWEGLLPTSPIGIADDFFAAGGTSLLAVSIVTRCNRELAIELPIRILFDHPTIARLAMAIRGCRKREPYRALVSLQAAGTKPPLFCVHPVGGQAFCYIEFAKGLGDDQPVFGLQASGLEAGEPLAASIESMAASYIEAIRTVQPQGPYRLLGYSFGGLVAYEMAHQLQRAGEQVEHLVLVDTAVDGAATPQISDSQLIAALAGMFFGELESSVMPSVCTVAEFVEAARDRGLMPADFSLAQTERIVSVLKNAFRLRRAYRPTRLSGSLILLRAVKPGDPNAADTERIFDWSQLLSQQPITIPISCTHYNMMFLPHAKTIAEALRPYLDCTVGAVKQLQTAKSA